MKKDWLLSLIFVFILPHIMMYAQSWDLCFFNKGPLINKAPMPEGRETMASRVIGGLDCGVAGNWWVAAPLARVDVYNLQTDTWVLKANLQEPKGGNGICTLDGKIYVTGDFSGPLIAGQNYESVYLYGPSTDNWTAKADMISKRAFHVSLALEKGLYLLTVNFQKLSVTKKFIKLQ